MYAIIEHGSNVCFEKDYAKIETLGGTVFNMVQKGKLYFLINVRVGQQRSRSLKEWHSVLGHCNTRDLFSVENVVNGMKIGDRSNFQCKMRIQGKMVQTFNRAPDRRATKPLELVHCDLAGPISPEAMDGFQYAVNVVGVFFQSTSSTVSITNVTLLKPSRNSLQMFPYTVM